MKHRSVRYSKIVVLIALLVLVACVSAKEQGTTVVAESRPTEISGTMLAKGPLWSLNRFVDKESGVVCWIYSASYGGGITCIPCSQLYPGACE